MASNTGACGMDRPGFGSCGPDTVASGSEEIAGPPRPAPGSRSGRRVHVRSIGTGPLAIGVVAMIVLVSFPLGTLASTALDPRTSAGVPTPLAAATSSAGNVIAGYVCLNVVPAASAGGCGAEPPLVNDTVCLSPWSDFSSSQPLVWPNDSTPCPVGTQTDSAGAFSLGYGNETGSAVLWSVNGSTYSGAFALLSLGNGSREQDLTASPYAAQSTRTYLLPGYSNLSRYAANHNGPWSYCAPGDGGICGVQVPILSWTQDGAFYVNRTDELVFDSFANQSVTAIAPWLPLYQNLMFYQGTENTEWTTTDGSWIYTYGCPTSCDSNSPLEFYAVNVTTGRTFSHTFAGVTESSVNRNGQVQMIGEDGNHSVVVLEASNGGAGATLYAWNLWNGTQWVLGSLPYFEANNNFWVDALNSFIDVEAQDSPADVASQWELVGPAPGTSVEEVASVQYYSGYTINGVDWGGYDVTTHEVAWDSEWMTVVYQLRWSPADGTFVLGSLRERWLPLDPSGDQLYNGQPWIPYPVSSEHRSEVVAGGCVPNMGVAAFGNDSVGVDPFTGTFCDSNVTWWSLGFVNTSAGAGYWMGGPPPWSVENQFYNSSYGILTLSTNCRSACSINGENEASQGTVKYVYPTAGPEFPFPATSSLAEPTPPGPVTGLAVERSTNRLVFFWEPPSSGTNPLLNYTLYWRIGSTPGQSENLLPSNHTFTLALPGLRNASELEYGVQAWNLHGGGPAALHEIRLVGTPVDFSERGLLNGTLWGVSLGGTTYTSSSPALSLFALNGAYPYTISAVSGWHQGTLPYSGTITVNGTPVDEPTLAFTPVTYEVTFKESGLPTGTNWSVMLGGAKKSSSTSTVTFTEPNGSDAYTVSDVPGWHQTALAYSGAITVNGASVAEPTLTFDPEAYPVTFAETGLPRGMEWYLNLTGGPSFHSTTGTIPFTDPNGTYRYAVGSDGSYTAAAPGGMLTVDGAPVGASIPFVRTYGLTFVRPAGTPTAAFWTIYVNATTASASVSELGRHWPSDIVRSTTANTLTVFVPNGTYDYAITVSGMPALTAQGTVTVRGSPAQVNPPPSPCSPVLGLCAPTGYGVLAVVLIGALSAIGAVALVIRRRRPLR